MSAAVQPDDAPRTAALAAGSGEAVVLEQPGSDARPVSPQRAQVVLVALAVAAFLMVTNESGTIGMIPTMSESLGVSQARLGLLSTAFAGAVMIATVPLALLTTRMIRRWVIVAAMVVFTLGTGVAAIAPDFTTLMVSRGITGASHALFWAAVTPAAAGMFPLKQRGKSVSRLLLGPSAAGLVGVPGAGYVAQHLGWNATFWILTAAGAVLALTIAVLMPSFRTAQATVVRGEFPMMGRFARIMGVTLAMTLSTMVTWAFFATYVTSVTGFADSTVPVLLLLGGVSGIATTWIVAKYLDRWPVRLIGLGFVVLVVMFGGVVAFGHIKAAMIAMILLQGFGWSIVIVGMVNWALRHSPWTADIGNGTYATFFNLGNAVGSVLGAAVLANYGEVWLPRVSLIAMTVAMVLVITVPGGPSRAAGSLKGLRERQRQPR